jgi:hypothetical protein
VGDSRVLANRTLVALVAVAGLAAVSPALATAHPLAGHPVKAATSHRLHKTRTAPTLRHVRTLRLDMTGRTAAAAPRSVAGQGQGQGQGQADRFTERQGAMARRDIHYDNTPAGIPDGVSTVGLVHKF